MPSVGYRLVEAAVRLSGARRAMQLTGAEAERAFEEGRDLPEPQPDVPRAFEGTGFEVAGRPCHRILPRGAAPGRALLYLNGGGFVRAASPRDFALAERLAESTGREVWLFCYPLQPRWRMHEIVDATLKAYQALLVEHAPDDVALFGLSSGACLALYLLNYVRHERLDVPLPGQLVLNSPVVELPASAAQLARMKALDARDATIPACYLGPDGLISCMLRAEPERWRYLSQVLEADMRGWPPVTAAFGTHECAYAYAPDFMAALRSAGVPRRLIEARGCGHCAIHYEGTPEAARLLELESRALKA